MRAKSSIQLLATLILFGSATFAWAVPSHMWSKRAGGSNPDGAWAVAPDGSNNVFFTGIFGPCSDFGSGIQCGPTGLDMFLVKYAPNGAYLWNKVFPAKPNDIGVDQFGNAYLVGVASHDVDFGGGVMPRDGVGIFLVKFDNNGNHQWSKRLSKLGSSIEAETIDVQDNGDFVVAGNFRGTFDFGDGPVTASVRHMFVAKYDANAELEWVIHHGATGIITPFDVALEASGNVVVTGYYSLTANFGGSDFTASTQDWEDIFLVKYDASGAHQWSKSFGGEFRDAGNSVDVDAAGNVYFTGNYEGAIDFGGGILVSTGFNIFLVKYDASGVHQWSHNYGGTSGASGDAISVDGTGGLVLSGSFRTSIDLGGGSLTSVGTRDLFLAGFDTFGGHQWSLRSGGPGSETPMAMALDTSNHVVVAGFFNNTTDFGGGPLTSAGWDDPFIVKFGETPLPVLISRFAATPRDAKVEIEWDISSDEPMEGFTLYRREITSSFARVIATGDPLVTQSFTDASVEAGKTYEFELVIRTISGDIYRSAPERVTVRGLTTSLGANYPNPFNPRTSIEYTLGERMPATIEIFDVSGAVVTRLVQGMREAGTHRVEWDGRDAAGRTAGSGVYFYRLADAPGVTARKMILLK